MRNSLTFYKLGGHMSYLLCRVYPRLGATALLLPFTKSCGPANSESDPIRLFSHVYSRYHLDGFMQRIAKQNVDSGPCDISSRNKAGASFRPDALNSHHRPCGIIWKARY